MESKDQRLSPQAWIDAATAVLVDQGIDHVRVDVLARELRVSRGSFYWHFRDREALLRAVLQHWADQTTAQLTQRLKTASGDAQERLAQVASLPLRGRSAARAARIELAIRAWARRDAMAREALDAADAQRIAYHAQIFKGLGFAASQAQHRAFLMYSYEVAESLLHRQGSARARAARQAFVLQLLQRAL
jgi:AcrR family transcriptional regulator